MQSQFHFLSPSSKLFARMCIQSFSPCLRQIFAKSSSRFDLSGQLCQGATSSLHGHSYQTANFHSSLARTAENATAMLYFKVQQRLHVHELSLLFPNGFLSLTSIALRANFTQRVQEHSITLTSVTMTRRNQMGSLFGGIPWIFII